MLLHNNPLSCTISARLLDRGGLLTIVTMLFTLLLVTTPTATFAQSTASDNPSSQNAWVDEFGAIAIQDGGRVMPIETYADRIAADLTGRSHWSASRGPAAFAGRDSVQLLCDLLFKPEQIVNQPLIAVENRPLKTSVGLDPHREFFSAMELFQNEKITDNDFYSFCGTARL